jgi:DNA-binding MarR family transcriptional regulator
MHVQRLPLHIVMEQTLHTPGIMRADMGTPNRELVVEWHELIARYARTTSALERALEHEHGLGVSEFEVLEQLAASDTHARRMQELAGAVHLSQSALSRVVARLETEGLVERGMCPEDRRGIMAHLTPDGRARYHAARPTHRAVLAETLDGSEGNGRRR